MKKYVISLLLVVALLVTAMAFTAQAAVEKNAVSQYASDTMSKLFVDTDHVYTMCPVCNKEVHWYALETGQTGACVLDAQYHWFLKTDVKHTGTGFYRVNSGDSICLYLNGKTVSNADYIALQAQGTLNVIGDETGTVSGGGLGNAAYGGAIDVRGGTLNLYGGNYKKTDGTTRPGPVIACSEDAAGIVNIYNGTTVTGGTNTGAAGGNIGVYAPGSQINIYGGTIQNGTAKNGGNIGVTGRASAVNIYDGTIDGGHAEFGGNIYVESSVTFTVTDGTIQNGNADQGKKLGGNIYIENAFLVLNGGEISGGSADKGGNLYLSQYMGGIGNITTTAGTITLGSATSGGSIYVAGGTATLKGLSISGGNATSQGGNIFSVGTLTLDDCSISGGTSKYQGGSIYASNGSTLTLTNTTVDGGTSSSNSGGAIAAENTTLTITGGEVKNGQASSAGGCIHTFSGGKAELTNVTISGGKAATGGNLNVGAPVTATGCTFSGGEANYGSFAYIGQPLELINCTVNETKAMVDAQVTINGGNLTFGTFGLRSGSSLILDGDAQVSGLDFQAENVTLSVKKTFTGTASVDRFQNMPAAPVFGKTLPNTYTAEGDFSGKLILNFVSEKPAVFNNGTALVVANVYTVKGEEYTWFKNNAAAVAGYGEADYLVPSAGSLDLTGANYVVNLDGRNGVNITGTGSVTVFDTANSDYTTYATVNIADNLLVNTDQTTQLGSNYYTVYDNGAYSFHRLSLRISSVSLRPGSAGIYYKGTWKCDDLLKTKIKSFGVAVSLIEQPDVDFADKTLYTAFAPSEFVSGEAKTSVIINNIFKKNIAAGEMSNDDRGKELIYAAAYVILDDGSAEGMPVVSQEEVAYSLYTVLDKMDESAYYENNKTALNSFYAKWENPLSGWGFDNIGKA